MRKQKTVYFYKNSNPNIKHPLSLYHPLLYDFATVLSHPNYMRRYNANHPMAKKKQHKYRKQEKGEAGLLAEYMYEISIPPLLAVGFLYYVILFSPTTSELHKFHCCHCKIKKTPRTCKPYVARSNEYYLDGTSFQRN